MKNDRRRRNRPRTREKKGVKQSRARNAGTYGRAAYALNVGACSKTHAQTVKNCPQDKILRAVQISEIVDGKSMTEAFYKISLA